MGELQHSEAKQHTISKNEDEIDRIGSRLENQKKKIEKIETTAIPMKYQVWIAGLASSRKRYWYGLDLDLVGRGPRHAGTDQKDSSGGVCFQN
jgi:hypothetical protein